MLQKAPLLCCKDEAEVLSVEQHTELPETREEQREDCGLKGVNWLAVIPHLAAKLPQLSLETIRIEEHVVPRERI